MTFRQRVEATRGLRRAYRKGLQALRPIDRARVRAVESRRLLGSVDVDGALSGSRPDEPRWDYVVGCRAAASSERFYWIEVHPASSGGSLREVGAKLDWLKDWLRKDGQMLSGSAREVVWIASGRCAFTKSSPDIKKLAAKGLTFEGRQFTIP